MTERRDSFYRGQDLEELFPELFRPDAVLAWVEMQAASRVNWPPESRSPQPEEDR